MKAFVILALSLVTTLAHAKVAGAPNAEQAKVFNAVAWILGTDEVLWATEIPFFTSETMAAGRMNYAYSVLGYAPLFTSAEEAEALAQKIDRNCHGRYDIACLANALVP